MGRLIRIFFTSLTILSVSLCLTLAIFWMRSRFTRDFIPICKAADGRERAIVSQAGRVWIGPIHHDPRHPQRFVRKREAREFLYVELLALAAAPATLHLLVFMIHRETRRRASIKARGEDFVKPFL